jgi:hypothetical protein
MLASRPNELEQGGFREPRVERDLGLPQHPDIVVVHHLLDRSRGFAQAARHVTVESDELGRLGKGISSPDVARIEKGYDRRQDGFLSLAPGDRLQRDLSSFQKLNQTDALDVLRGISLAVLGSDEPE